jgi:hypothetical protein
VLHALCTPLLEMHHYKRLLVTKIQRVAHRPFPNLDTTQKCNCSFAYEESVDEVRRVMEKYGPVDSIDMKTGDDVCTLRHTRPAVLRSALPDSSGPLARAAPAWRISNGGNCGRGRPTSYRLPDQPTLFNGCCATTTPVATFNFRMTPPHINRIPRINLVAQRVFALMPTHQVGCLGERSFHGKMWTDAAEIETPLAIAIMLARPES